jgi:hypothetical protein
MAQQNAFGSRVGLQQLTGQQQQQQQPHQIGQQQAFEMGTVGNMGFMGIGQQQAQPSMWQQQPAVSALSQPDQQANCVHSTSYVVFSSIIFS